ncbi:MAG: glutathione S-transferase family protein [Pseudomonadales bacterium]|nr:glutathione S-transferase family protein [Pseudomonadales bacterium]
MPPTTTPLTPYRLLGGPGSPYSLKMRALLRYRRLPHLWIVPRGYIGKGGELAAAGKGMIPVLQYPDGSYHADSTPLAVDLERRHPGQRSVLPADPAVALLSHLIEDMADELLVAAMFDLRWGSDIDRQFCATRQLAGWLGPVPKSDMDATVARFTHRQTQQRTKMVMADNHEGLMALYQDVLAVMEDMLQRTSYLFGERPALADFGLYGQLSQCAIDPSASAIMRARAPRTFQWTQSLDDACGVDGEWAPRDIWEPSVRRMLELVGRFHLPLLAANHAAVENAQAHFEAHFDGRHWRLPAQSYKHKCLVWLRREWQALPSDAQASIRGLLADTGCLDTLAAGTEPRLPVPAMAPL